MSKKISEISNSFFSYLSQNYPLMSSCDEFYFFPSINKPLNLLNSLETLEKEKRITLQINLTYNKKDILQLVDDVISKAQKITGKSPEKGVGKRAITIEQEKLIERSFEKYYLAGDSKEEALSKTSNDLSKVGISMDVDSINRIYLPRLKNKRKIKDIRELKKGGGDK